MKKPFSILPIALMILFIACEKEELSEADLTSLELSDQIALDLNNGSNGAAKVDICHKGNLINVSVNALKAHIAHGDAIDMDGDGYFDAACDCSEEVDTNDSDPNINPGTEDPCEGAVDMDGDGYYDRPGPCGEEVDTDDSDPNVNPGTEDSCGDAVDMDGDGYYDRPGPCGEEVDCDDSDPTIHPGAEEICGDGIDQNCDGLDEECTCPCFSKEDLALVAWEPWDCLGWSSCNVITNKVIEDGSCGGEAGRLGLAAAGCPFVGFPAKNEAWLIDYTDGKPNWTPDTKPACGNLQEGEVLACQQLILEKYEELNSSVENNSGARISATETDNIFWKKVTRQP